MEVQYLVLWYLGILGPGWAIVFAAVGLAMFFYGLHAHSQGKVVDEAGYMEATGANAEQVEEAWSRVYVAVSCTCLGPAVIFTPLWFQVIVDWLR